MTVVAFASFLLIFSDLGGFEPARTRRSRPPLNVFEIPPPEPVAESEPAIEPRRRPVPAATPNLNAGGARERRSNSPSPPARTATATRIETSPEPLTVPILDVPLPGPIAIGAGTGIPGSGTGSGSGQGRGAGRGDGQGEIGGGETVRYARANWIEQPSPADIRRSWPLGVRRLESAVTVLLRCNVRRNGRPYRCKLEDDGGDSRGFAEASMRLVELGRVQPVLRDGRAADLPVLIPFTFAPDRRQAGAEPATPGPTSRIATACLKPIRTSGLRNVCDFAVDAVFCVETAGNAFSCGVPGGRITARRMRVAARSRFEWPSELQRLRMEKGEQVALIACRHDPADPTEPRLTSIQPAAGQCV